MSYILCWPHSTQGVTLIGKSGKEYKTDSYGNCECSEEDARHFMSARGGVGLQCIPELPPEAPKKAKAPAPAPAKAPAKKAEKKSVAPAAKKSAAAKFKKAASGKKSASKKK